MTATLLTAALLTGCGDDAPRSGPTDAAPAAAAVADSAPADRAVPAGPKACGLDSVSNVVGEALANNPAIAAPLVVGGWYFLPAADGSPTPARLRAVPIGASQGRDSVEIALQADRERADLAESLGESARMSGFRGTIDDIAPGGYRLELVFDSPDGEVVCGRSRELIVR